MDAQRIKAFIDAMAASDLAEMEFSQDGWTLRLVRHPIDALQPTTPRAARTESIKELRAPLHGVIHLQRAPGEPPFIVVGQAVHVGQTLCVIEAMKVFNEVRAEFDGTVDAVLVASADEVEFGQPLFRFA